MLEKAEYIFFSLFFAVLMWSTLFSLRSFGFPCIVLQKNAVLRNVWPLCKTNIEAIGHCTFLKTMINVQRQTPYANVRQKLSK